MKGVPYSIFFGGVEGNVVGFGYFVPLFVTTKLFLSSHYTFTI